MEPLTLMYFRGRSKIQQMTSELWGVSKSDLTPERCMSAVRNNGWSLAYVPEEMQTPDIIEAAINQTEWAIVFVKNTETRRAYIQKHGKFSKEVQKDLENNKLL
jgi:hypothetical protein